MSISVVSNGRIRKSDDLAFADLVLQSKINKGMWPTIDLLVQYWAEQSPDDFRAFKVQVSDTRADLRDKTYGQTADKNMERRLTMVFPEALHNLIRVVYKPNELKMDKAFNDTFARRYPIFRIAQKI